ncbi:MAG: endonuclease/exonuclease/phosphatase family protein [Spirochaetota bacterium]
MRTKPPRRGWAAILPALALFLGARCSLPWNVPGPRVVEIVSYNAHNLFDDQQDGGEYPEFIPGSSGWNASLYKTRLENTAFAAASPFSGDGAATTAPSWPDILCLAEIEGEKVLKDLAEGPMAKVGYRWMALGTESASAIRCGILSRFPILACRSHALGDAWGFGPLRDMLEVDIGLWEDGKSGGKGDGEDGEVLTLFLCHWKSRKEGARETEEARRQAAELLSRRMREIQALDPLRALVACGDFNENPDEYLRAGRAYPTAFAPPDSGSPGKPGGTIEVCSSLEALKAGPPPSQDLRGSGSLRLFSPWEQEGGYSYVFQGAGERLDGFLLAPSLADGKGLEFDDFRVGSSPELFGQDGVPAGWNGRSGYSDHLPVGIRLSSSLYNRGGFMEK